MTCFIPCALQQLHSPQRAFRTLFMFEESEDLFTLRRGGHNSLCQCLASGLGVVGPAKTVIDEGGRVHLRCGELVAFGYAERRAMPPQNIAELISQPALVTELECGKKALRQLAEKRVQHLRRCFQVWR